MRREWGQKNKQVIKEYHDHKMATNVSYRITVNLRKRLCIAIRGNQKTGSAVDDLGCTIEEFKVYFETLFQPGMTWENWGRAGWHIDHIIPLSSFNLTDRQQLLKACNYKNLQPLWAEENWSKGDNIVNIVLHESDYDK